MSILKNIEESLLSGELDLSGKKLKEFPNTDKYSLSDLVSVDLSRNRLNELPQEITKLWCLERLDLCSNIIRTVPTSVSLLQSLTYLDLCHNQLQQLPSVLFSLPLEILLVSSNKLQSLPSEVSNSKTLMELDVSCNMLVHLPVQLGKVQSLKHLNVRNNRLLELPMELMSLRLKYIDISENKISSLPTELKGMTSLETICLAANPLVHPPMTVCMRGRVHIFKWLSNELSKSTSSGKPSRSMLQDVSLSYLLSDKKKTQSLFSSEARQFPSDLSTDMSKYSNTVVKSSEDVAHSSGSLEGKKTPHIQTYKEYKESLKQQRMSEATYKPRDADISIKVTGPENLGPAKSVKLKDEVQPFKWDIGGTQFTMRREYNKVQEETKLVQQLRTNIESVLKVKVTEHIGSALSDGVILCHLANCIRPQIISSIHVPSPAVPRLTMARCRKNVENFIEACRKIGIQENLLCSPQDILLGKSLVPIAVTVTELLRLRDT